MMSPIKDLQKSLEEIQTQLNICKENKQDIHIVKEIRNTYRDAIKVLKDFGFKEQSTTVYKPNKLTEVAVQKIRKECNRSLPNDAVYSVRGFSIMYDVSETTILNVLNRKSWKHVKEEV